VSFHNSESEIPTSGHLQNLQNSYTYVDKELCGQSSVKKEKKIPNYLIFFWSIQVKNSDNLKKSEN
jgi:hypothetical protein